MGALRYVVYAAVALSLSVYAYRAYRKWFAPKADGDAPDPGPGATTPDPARPPATPLPEAPPSKPKVSRGLGFTDPRSILADEEPRPESLVQEVIREELAKKQGTAPAAAPSTPAAGRSGLFAPGEGSPRTDRVSVAAALTGVRLPDDLVPLVGDEGVDPHHVLFHATETPAAQIGRHLGDELERLGYQIRSETDTVAVATKGAVELRVTLHPDAGLERVDGRARFPTAGPTSVVVELET